MAQQIKKKFLAPEIIDYFDDQIDLVEQGLAQELLDRAQGDLASIESANDYTDAQIALIPPVDLSLYETIVNVDLKDAAKLAEAKAYTDSQIATIPSVDLSNYYNKSEVDGKDLVLSNKISALESYDQETVHVDDVNGVDEVGRGSMLRPFKTINYAYSQVPSLGAPSNTTYNANVGRYVTEKLVIHLAPGRYAENVVLGFKRARVRITGDGATIVGDVKMSVKLADFPAASLENFKNSFPAPYTGASAFMNFEVVGKSGGGGLESDPTANVLVVTGQVSMAFEETTVPGSGVIFPNWDGSFGQFYAYLRGASVGNFVVTTSHNAATPTLPAGVIEIESCNIASSSATYRMHTGIVPYAYLADFATWNTTTKGTANKTPTGTWTLKAHNSTFGNVIGPRLTLGEMDGCRIYDIDRSMRGTVDNGAISGSTSTSYLGIINNQFRIYGGSGDLASAYKIGQASGSTRYKIDSVSYTTLAFSRNSSGVLTARTLDVGGGVNYDLLDDARSVFVNDPATNYSRSANTVDAALEGIDTALGLKANQSSIASIESNVSSLQSSVSTLQGTTSSLQTQVNTEKGRIDAILLSSQADKDSFAEIVALINSVDIENDTAFAGYVLSNDAAVAGLDSRIDSLEAKGFAKGSQVIGAELGFIDLDRQYSMILSVSNGRLSAHEGEDFTVSVIGGVTRLTWISSFANPDGVEKVQAGDKIFWSGAF
jgi:hypothetical protein